MSAVVQSGGKTWDNSWRLSLRRLQGRRPRLVPGDWIKSIKKSFSQSFSTFPILQNLFFFFVSPGRLRWSANDVGRGKTRPDRARVMGDRMRPRTPTRCLYKHTKICTVDRQSDELMIRAPIEIRSSVFTGTITSHRNRHRAEQPRRRKMHYLLNELEEYSPKAAKPWLPLVLVDTHRH